MPVIPLSSVSANTLRVLGQLQLPATETNIYTVPANAQTDIPPQRIIAVNKESGGRLLTIHLRVNGAATSPANVLLNGLSIPGNTTLALDFGLTMAAGDILSGFGSTADSFTITVCGFESTA